MNKLGKLIPLAEYTKPLLKLNTADKKEISALKNRIRRHQFKLSFLEDEFNNPGVSRQDKLSLRARMADITDEIRFLHEKIRDVKINRHEQQMLDLTI